MVQKVVITRSDAQVIKRQLMSYRETYTDWRTDEITTNRCIIRGRRFGEKSSWSGLME